MYSIYKKVEKTPNNEFGLEVVKEDENPFLSGPVVLTILALALNEKSINGALRQTMEGVRLKTSKNENSGKSISQVPFNLLTLSFAPKKEGQFSFQKNSANEKDTKEFIEKYFYPLISNKNSRLPLLEAQKRLRNVNIVSYCNGTYVTNAIEKNLENKMKELNYSDEEINNLLSQICSFPIADGIVKGNEKLTTVSFKDLKDIECRDSLMSPLILNKINEKMSNENQFDKVDYYKISNNEGIFLTNGEEEFDDAELYHNLKRYTEQNKNLSVGFASALTNAIDNSVENFKNKNNFSQINVDTLTKDFPQITNDLKNNLPKEKILEKIDKNLSYLNAIEKKNEIFNHYNLKERTAQTNKVKNENKKYEQEL